jgi:hypothetical protein
MRYKITEFYRYRVSTETEPNTEYTGSALLYLVLSPLHYTDLKLELVTSRRGAEAE